MLKLLDQIIADLDTIKIEDCIPPETAMSEGDEVVVKEVDDDLKKLFHSQHTPMLASGRRHATISRW